MEPNTETGAETRLTFTSEAGSSVSKWVAAILSIALIAWMGSGYLKEEPSGSSAKASDVSVDPVAVEVTNSTEGTVTRVLRAEGYAQPDRESVIKSEGSGRVESLLVEKGDDLASDAVIARLEMRELKAALAQAEEELDRAQANFDNARSLFDRGVGTRDRLRESRSALAGARTGVTQAEEALDNAVIRVPFAGRLDALEVSQGDVVSPGSDVGTIVDLDPLTVEIRVPQRSLSDIAVGQSAEINFITGEQRAGDVTYISSRADPETRTFGVEVEVENSNGMLSSGVSAQVRIPTAEISAHFVSPAILALGRDGELGVKTVDDRDHVVFVPVEMVRAEADGVWISGLSETARIISVGQGFVRDGEQVDPRPAETEE